MKIVALMAWYDEQAETLDRAVRSAANAGVDEIIAVDGAYAMVPGAQGSSPTAQREAIEAAARVTGMRFTVFDGHVWENEILKRDFMFRCADVYGEDDWLLILDADFEVKGNLRKAIFNQSLRSDVVARVMNALLTTPDGPMKDLRYGVAPSLMFRCLYRGGQGIRVEGNHYTYTAADGARLWGSALGVPPLEVPVTVEGIEIMHWTYFRDPTRVARQISYYQERDRTGIERGPCIECGTVSTCFVPRVVADNKDEIDTRFAEVCDKCAPDFLVRERLKFAQAGGDDPTQLKIIRPTA